MSNVGNKAKLTCAYESHSQLNQRGGFYRPGHAFSPEKWQEAITKYGLLLESSENNTCSSRQLADTLSVSHTFAQKVIKAYENEDFTTINSPRKFEFSGAGSRSFSEEDILCLMELRYENPYRSNSSYIRGLKRRTGTTTSKATISRFWKDMGRKQRLGSVVPAGKFTLNNRKYYGWFCRTMDKIDRKRLVFADEKLLKGCEMFSRKGRADDNGHLPPLVVLPDYSNTYCIMGLLHCNNNKDAAYLAFSIGEENHDSFCFREFISVSVASGVLAKGDVLVVDNASIHVSGENNDLDEFLWEEFSILMLRLPTYSPELNPIELIWNLVVMRMRSFTLENNIDVGYTTRDLAICVMKKIRRKDVKKAYNRCGYF